MNNIRTVSDTKRAFYAIHTRPVNSIYRRVVEEMMVEMHLLRVNEDFRYDSIFALGVVTTFDRFMEGYQPSTDQEPIFNALCQAEEMSAQQLRQDSQCVQELVQSKSADEVLEWISQSAASGGDSLQGQLQTIAENSQFKYGRLFGIGLYTMLELADAAMVKDDDRLNQALAKICTALNISENKIQKDWELYRSNLEKMVQTRQAMADILAAERKRRQQAEAEKAKAESDSTPDDTPSPNSDPPLEISS